MESSNFYTTLFSTTSLEYYEDNCSSDFRNHLAIPISPGYPLEVGLASLTYTDAGDAPLPNIPIPVTPTVQSFFGGQESNGILQFSKKERISSLGFVKEGNEQISTFVSFIPKKKNSKGHVKFSAFFM